MEDTKAQKKVAIGVTEGVRRTTGVTPITGQVEPPDPEVPEAKARRRFTAQYKLRILEEADACKEPGRWAPFFAGRDCIRQI